MQSTYTWASVIGRNGQTLTHPLVRLGDKRLFCPVEGIQMIPRGTFCLCSDFRSPEFPAYYWDDTDLFLNRQDLRGINDTGEWGGCCGPSGFLPNLEDDEGLPMAYEFADCHGTHYVRIPQEWYALRPTPGITDEPVLLVGTVLWRGRVRLVERAVGHTRPIAAKLLREAALRVIGRQIGRQRKKASIRQILTQMEIHQIPLSNLGWFDQRRSWFRD